ncbi:MAG: ribosome maturation factor RimM [Candidatus Tyrphobacter sp.]
MRYGRSFARRRRAASRSTSSTARRRPSRSSATADVVAGRITGAFGVRGEVKCSPTSAARALFVEAATFRYERGHNGGSIHLTAVREHAGQLLLSVEGVGDRSAAQALRDATLFVPKDAIVLRSGEYLDDDLVGCRTVGADGREYGRVERIEHLAATDMLVVGGRMIPMVAAIVLDIDIADGRITIDPPTGLLD